MKISIILVIFTVCFFSLSLQTINIPLCKNALVSVRLSTTAGVIDDTTAVTLCHDTQYLYVNW